MNILPLFLKINLIFNGYVYDNVDISTHIQTFYKPSIAINIKFIMRLNCFQ